MREGVRYIIWSGQQVGKHSQDLHFLISIAPFTIKLSLGASRDRNPEPEPPGKHGGTEKLPFNGRKPGTGPGSQGGTIVQKRSWVQEEQKRETGQRERKQMQ